MFKKSWNNDTKLSNNFTLREFTKSQTATRKGIDNSVTDKDWSEHEINCNLIIFFKIDFLPTFIIITS